MIKMKERTCMMCQKPVRQYLKGYKNQGYICLDCYYGKNKSCICEFCNKKFNIKLFDTLRGKVICPVCKRKNYIKEKGGLVHEDLSQITTIPHNNRYIYLFPSILNKYMKILEKKYRYKSRELIVFTALSEYILSKILITDKDELLALRPRSYKREKLL